MNNAPEKIYGWLDTQLSIARFYGGINYNGHRYVIDMDDPQHPLVRVDPKPKTKKRKQQPAPDSFIDLFAATRSK